MRRPPKLGPKIMAVLGAGLCFLTASFLCGFDACDGNPAKCKVGIYAPGTYTIIWKRDSDKSFAHMTIDFTGDIKDEGDFFLNVDRAEINDCAHVESIQVLHTAVVVGQVGLPEQSIDRETPAGSGK